MHDEVPIGFGSLHRRQLVMLTVILHIGNEQGFVYLLPFGQPLKWLGIQDQQLVWNYGPTIRKYTRVVFVVADVDGLSWGEMTREPRVQRGQ